VYAAFARHGQPGADGVMRRRAGNASAHRAGGAGGCGRHDSHPARFSRRSFGVGHALAQHPTDRALTIEVSGRQWWWQFDYQHPDPSKRVRTANEVHIPIGRPVQFVLEGRDVIHSLWAPSLDGKRDLIPGMRRVSGFRPILPASIADSAPSSAAISTPRCASWSSPIRPRPFDRWYAAQQAPAPEPTDSMTATGRRVFLAGPCSSCHSIAGTPANGKTGPDLSHLASRLTIGAGILAEHARQPRGWIVDPQGIKPGSKMPSNQLSPRDLQALLAYLVTLK
jgi:cytochrome c oxidase subunit 2